MARPAPSDEELSDLVRRVGLARDGRAAQALLRRNPKLHHLSTVAYLSDAVAKVIHVDLDHAERLSTAAGWLAARVGDDHGRARAMRALGNVRFSRGKYAQALGLWDEAVDLFRSRGSEIEVGRTLSNSLQALIFLGRYEEASRRALVARGLLERAGDRVCLARLDCNLANLFYRQDRFPEALELYRRAYEQFLEQGGIHDVAAALRNMAVCYISLNQFDEALASHREARAFCEKHGLLLLVVGADYNVAYLHYLRGEYTKAIELYRLARERSEKLGDAYHRALCDLDQSELYLELNLIDEGVQLATEAFEGFEALKMGYEAAKALTNLAIGAGRQGEAFRALGLFGKAREMFVREGNDVWPALIDAYRALVLQHEGRLSRPASWGKRRSASSQSPCSRARPRSASCSWPGSTSGWASSAPPGSCAWPPSTASARRTPPNRATGPTSSWARSRRPSATGRRPSARTGRPTRASRTCAATSSRTS